MLIDQFFYENPVFRYEEFADWKAQHSEMQEVSLNSALHYYVKTGRIKPIRRKLYAVIPPGESSDTLLVDAYLIAGKATEDAILGYHTALELMGLAYSTFGQFIYLTEQKSKPFEYQGQWFQSVSMPTVLREKGKSTFGVDVIRRQGIKLQVTNVARTFVDVLDRVELSGGWEEVCRSIANIAVLNVDEVVEYCLLLENARLAAKVGYFLSLREGAFAVSQKQLAPLLEVKPKVPQYVSKQGREKVQLVKQWNIFLPVSVIQQSWEEPDVNV